MTKRTITEEQAAEVLEKLPRPTKCDYCSTGLARNERQLKPFTVYLCSPCVADWDVYHMKIGVRIW